MVEHNKNMPEDSAALFSFFAELTGELLQQEITPAFYHRMLEHAVTLIPAAEGGSVLLRHDDGYYRFAAALGYDLDALQDVALGEHQLYYDIHDHSQRSFLVYDLHTLNQVLLEPAAQARLQQAGNTPSFRASLAVPIRVMGEAVAVLSLDGRSLEAFDGAARVLAEAFGQYLGVLWQRLRLQEEVLRSAQLQRLLIDIERWLTAFVSLEDFFARLAAMLGQQDILAIQTLRIAKLHDQLLLSYYPLASQEALADLSESAVAGYEAGGQLSLPWLRAQALQQSMVLYAATLPADGLAVPAEESGEALGGSLLLCPLRCEGKLWGLLECYAREARGFPPWLQKFLQQVVASVDVALGKEADREHAALQLAKLNSLVQVSSALRGVHSRQAVYDRALEALLAMSRADSCSLVMLEPSPADVADVDVPLTSRLLRVVAALRRDEMTSLLPVGHEIAYNQRTMWSALCEKTTVHMRNVQGLRRALELPYNRPLIEFVSTVIVDQSGAAIGVVSAALEDANQSFAPDDIAFLESVAQACSNALIRIELIEQAQERADQYQQLYREAERQARDLRLLDEVRTAIARILDLDALLRAVVEAIAEVLGFTLVSIFLRQGDQLRMHHYKGYSHIIESMRLDQGISGKVARTGQAILVENADDDPDFLQMSDDILAQVSVPLCIRGEVFAVLNVESRRAQGQGLHAEDLRLMRALAEHINVAAERAQLYGELQANEQRFRLLAENMRDMVCLHDKQGYYRYVSPSCQQLLGYSPDALLAQHPQHWIHPEDSQALRDWQDWSERRAQRIDLLSYRVRRHDGAYIWFETTLRPLAHEEGFVSVSRDISNRKQVEHQLAYSASHDALTAVANRAHFMQQLETTLSQARSQQQPHFAVLFIDLDHFKHVNDSMGHSVGDAVLVEVSKRLQASVRQADMVARLGGDEFAVLLHQVRDSQDAEQSAARIHQALAKPFVLEGRRLHCSASVGIALSSTGYRNIQEILRDADMGMYHAKHNGRARYVTFDSRLQAQALRTLALEQELTQQPYTQMHLLYQPIVSLHDGRWLGVEALLRWQHPRFGLLEPAAFIALAKEDDQVMRDLGMWVLQQACGQLRQWQSLAASQLYMNINVAVSQLAQASFAEQLCTLLYEHGLAAEQLRLDLNEGDVFLCAQLPDERINALQRLGVSLYIDDFGSGYASLSHLHYLPIEGLKIDPQLVKKLTSSDDDEAQLGRSVIQTIVALATTLRTSVLAEGVESAEQDESLRILGCGVAQGYYLAPPMPASALEQALEHHRGDPLNPLGRYG